MAPWSISIAQPAWIHSILEVKVGYNLLSNFFSFTFTLMQCKLIIGNIFLLTYFTNFAGKIKINHLGTWEECFDWKHVIYICFPWKSQKVVIFLGKMQEIYKCFRSKYQQYPAKFGQIMVFPTPGISLMTKDLIKIKVYTYFNIGDAKIKKWKEKQSKFYPTP